MTSERTNLSPFELMYKAKMIFPSDLSLQNLDLSVMNSAQVLLSGEIETFNRIVKDNLLANQASYKEQYDKTATAHNFCENDVVFMVDENQQDKHAQKFLGPFRIETLRTNLALLRHVYTQKLWKSYVHVSKLKKDKSLARDRVLRKYRQQDVPDAVENDVRAPEEPPQLGPTIDLEPAAVAEAPALVQAIEHAPRRRSGAAIQTRAENHEGEMLSSEQITKLNSNQTNQKAWLEQVIESSRKLYALMS